MCFFIVFASAFSQLMPCRTILHGYALKRKRISSFWKTNEDSWGRWSNLVSVHQRGVFVFKLFEFPLCDLLWLHHHWEGHLWLQKNINVTSLDVPRRLSTRSHRNLEFLAVDGLIHQVAIKSIARKTTLTSWCILQNIMGMMETFREFDPSFEQIWDTHLETYWLCSPLTGFTNWSRS